MAWESEAAGLHHVLCNWIGHDCRCAFPLHEPDGKVDGCARGVCARRVGFAGCRGRNCAGVDEKECVVKALRRFLRLANADGDVELECIRTARNEGRVGGEKERRQLPRLALGPKLNREIGADTGGLAEGQGERKHQGSPIYRMIEVCRILSRMRFS